MRKLWLLVTFLILLPVVVTSLKVSGYLDWAVLEPLWILLLIVLLATMVARFLPRLGNWRVHWRHGNSWRNQGGSDEKNPTADSTDRIITDFQSRPN